MMKKNSERNAAIRFMKKLFILFIPFIALLAVYFLDDPFMVLKNYERYDQTPVVLFFGRVTKFGTSSQFNGILPECLLHTVYIVRLLLTCMYPFIQEQIGYISQ